MKTNKTRQSASILGVAMFAAAWLIGGPDILSEFGASERLAELLTMPVSMIAFIWIISRDSEMIACERRIFKRLIGK